MCCSGSQNWLIITVLKFTRNPISIVVYIKTGQRNTIYHRDSEKARKSSEHGPENSKRKFNQTRRRSDNGRSARVDCHIYRKRNKYRQSRCYTFSAFAWTLHFFQFCHQRGKRCNLFSFSSKGFGNLKKVSIIFCYIFIIWHLGDNQPEKLPPGVYNSNIELAEL